MFKSLIDSFSSDIFPPLTERGGSVVTVSSVSSKRIEGSDTEDDEDTETETPKIPETIINNALQLDAFRKQHGCCVERQESVEDKQSESKARTSETERENESAFLQMSWDWGFKRKEEPKTEEKKRFYPDIDFDPDALFPKLRRRSQISLTSASSLESLDPVTLLPRKSLKSQTDDDSQSSRGSFAVRFDLENEKCRSENESETGSESTRPTMVAVRHHSSTTRRNATIDGEETGLAARLSLGMGPSSEGLGPSSQSSEGVKHSPKGVRLSVEDIESSPAVPRSRISHYAMLPTFIQEQLEEEEKNAAREEERKRRILEDQEEEDLDEQSAERDLRSYIQKLRHDSWQVNPVS